MAKKDLAKIKNPGIRSETEQARELMLIHPAQFVGLMVVGNQTLIEPHGFGVKALPQKLRKDFIEVYNHDVSEIVTGAPQAKYDNARLRVDESAKEGEVRYAARGGAWIPDEGRFDVLLDYGFWYSGLDVAGLGFFRPSGNQAYFDVEKALEE